MTPWSEDFFFRHVRFVSWIARDTTARPGWQIRGNQVMIKLKNLISNRSENKGKPQKNAMLVWQPLRNIFSNDIMGWTR